MDSNEEEYESTNFGADDDYVDKINVVNEKIEAPTTNVVSVAVIIEEKKVPPPDDVEKKPDAPDDGHGGLSADDAVAMLGQDAPAEEEVKKKVQKKRVNIFQLYHYAEGFDYILIIIGLLCATVQGFCIQYPFVGVGKVISIYSYALANCTVTNSTANPNATVLPTTMAQTTSMMTTTAASTQFNETMMMTTTEYMTMSTAAASSSSDCNTSALMNWCAALISIDFAIFGILCCVTSYAHVALFTIVSDRVSRKVRRLAFSNILRQHIGYFDVHFGGELNTRLTQDVTKYEVGIGSKVSLAVAWIMTFLFGMILCLIKGWQLTLIMCIMLPIAAVLSGVTGRVMKLFTEKEMTAYAKAGGVAEEAFFNIKIVNAFAGQNKEASRYDKLLEDARNISLKSAVASAFGVGLPFLLILIVTAVTVWLSALFVQEGLISPGFVMQLFASMMIGLRSLGYAAGALEVVADSQGAAYGIYEIVEAKTLIDSTDPGGDTIPNLKGLIRFEEIHFVYPARANVTVLQGLTLDILPAQTAALVGPSGCGKSTTIQLIQRFYDPDAGTVYLDGRNIKELNISWLRKQIGVVSQEPVLFATSIEENIRFGNPDCTIEDIMTAAKEADAHNFINKLPEKYSTVLNEMGTQLSRGEKQRISLARALVRNPKILLLDECTSALDNESEAAVQAALDKASKGRTTIIIAHRLSTVRDSDVLFCVDKGVVAEKGTHEELLARHALYHKLVSTQMLAKKKKVPTATLR